jgi:Photosynthetic reaction centre cytochrome C subunit
MSPILVLVKDGSMRSSATLLLGSLLIASLPLAAQDTVPGAPPVAQAQPGGHHAMPKPKNLQVLPKDIATPDLIALMRGYTKALGVECEFCHEPNAQTGHPDFASDAKPEKGTARTMIVMTNEINARYLSTVKDPDASPAQKVVTCGTCHRGDSMPAPFDGTTEHHDMPAKNP